MVPVFEISIQNRGSYLEETCWLFYIVISAGTDQEFSDFLVWRPGDDENWLRLRINFRNCMIHLNDIYAGTDNLAENDVGRFSFKVYVNVFRGVYPLRIYPVIF